MLKEVGASGQISLGKRFAGQLFDATFHPDGRVELLPMKVVPAVAPTPKPEVVPTQQAWEADAANRQTFEAMNAYYDRVGSTGTRLAKQRRKLLDDRR